MSTDALARAFASTRAVVAAVRPGELDRPTPCRSWTVRQLLNHMVAAPRVGVAALETGEFPSGEAEDVTAGDFLAAYDATVEQTTTAFARPGVFERTVALPFGEVPAAFLMTMITTDQFTHGWDLARATGQPTDLDPALAAELLAGAAIPDEFRGPDGVAPFGPAQAAPAGATEADKLAAHLGRTV